MAIVVIAPFFGSQVFQRRVKLFFSIVVTIAVMPAAPLSGAEIPVDAPMLQVLILIIKEVIVGVALGLVGQIIFAGVQFGGQFISIQTALGFANIIDPRTQTQNPIFSQLFSLLGIILFLAMEGERIYLRAMMQSFETVPLGTPELAMLGPEFIKMASDIFVIGVRLASPFIVVLFLMDLSFAIFARIMPQANIFFVALPLKVGGGILILYFVAPKLPVAFEGFFDRLWEYMYVVLNTMGG